jgi:GNAT superfamily N-acetyltransferase
VPRVSRTDARAAILATLAADTACDAAALADDGVTVVEHREVEGRRRFDMPSKAFQIVTAGHGVVVSCHRDWLDWARERAALGRGEFLAPANIAAVVALLEPDGYALVGPQVRYGCSADTLRPASPPPGVTLDVVAEEGVEALRPLDAFRNALPARQVPARPDRIAVTAMAGRDVVGCAAASDENDRLWQIGVDVLAPYRGRGIGRAVVARLTESILDAGKVPYYSHSISNIPSAALATSLGFWPAWVEWYAREQR